MLAPRSRPAPRVPFGALLVAATLALGACGSDDDDDDMDPVTDTGSTDGAGQTSMPAPGTDPNAPPDLSPVTYAFPLTVEEEVPEPVNVPDGATGEATITFDRSTMGISGSVTTSGLSGPPQEAHIHEQMFEGSELQPTGPIIVPFIADGSGEGFVLADDAVLTEEQAESLETGLLYVNVHTELNPAGEIRGQIVRDEEGGADGADTDADGT